MEAGTEGLNAVPPPPPGFTLDAPAQRKGRPGDAFGAVPPPPPPGFTLDARPASSNAAPALPTGPGGLQVPEKGVPGPSEPPPPVSPRAQALKETITGPSAPGTTQDFFKQQREIETRLRS